MPGTDLQKAKRHYILTGLIVGCCTIALTYLLIPQTAREQKKTVDRLLTHFNTGRGAEELAAARALQQIGTNALPHLVSIIRKRNSNLELRLSKLIGDRLAAKLGIEDHRGERARAVTAIWFLGEEAAPAIPALAKSVYEGRNTDDAADALLGIGPKAVRQLTNIVTHPDVGVRIAVVDGLARYHFNFNRRRLELPEMSEQFIRASRVVVPLLVRFTDDAEPVIRAIAARGLGEFPHYSILAEFPNYSQTVLPVLIKLLRDPKIEARREAVTSLRGLKEDAKPAIPALLEYIKQTQDMRDRTSAMLAVWDIDRKAAEDAGFQIRQLDPSR